MSRRYIIAQRRAILCGTTAQQRAEQEQHRRLRAEALERDRRLAAAIRKASQ
jgi:hypothetical protein